MLVFTHGGFTIKTNLKQSEEFEDDHDNDNHSDDVKDVSVHAGDSYQSECAVASIIGTRWGSFTGSGRFAVEVCSFLSVRSPSEFALPARRDAQ